MLYIALDYYNNIFIEGLFYWSKVLYWNKDLN